MMKRLLQSVLLVTCLTACPSTERHPETFVSVESYHAAIAQIRSNLVLQVKPTMVTALGESTKSVEWKTSQLDVVDDTITLCDDVLKGAKAGTATTESGQ